MEISESFKAFFSVFYKTTSVSGFRPYDLNFLTDLPYLALKHYFVLKIKLMLLFPGKMCDPLKFEVSNFSNKSTTIFVKRKLK